MNDAPVRAYDGVLNERGVGTMAVGRLEEQGVCSRRIGADPLFVGTFKNGCPVDRTGGRQRSPISPASDFE
ncbi:hypothetical protein EAH89_29635 [Roseomonas nepalensis]|uniref:Uncharacterized protein n=1 Tax=Muricoccus nepalensis TaxID=1854500 RepID=A0A502EK15_9PROT|nr:hypothetical protein [Roseomonas nepalensis]TPG38048.1 hypothetical protein EAH89_29635 [Roseomonas nepalensis]